MILRRLSDSDLAILCDATVVPLELYGSRFREQERGEVILEQLRAEGLRIVTAAGGDLDTAAVAALPDVVALDEDTWFNDDKMVHGRAVAANLAAAGLAVARI
jgi:hypothetical protein